MSVCFPPCFLHQKQVSPRRLGFSSDPGPLCFSHFIPSHTEFLFQSEVRRIEKFPPNQDGGWPGTSCQGLHGSLGIHTTLVLWTLPVMWPHRPRFPRHVSTAHPILTRKGTKTCENSELIFGPRCVSRSVATVRAPGQPGCVAGRKGERMRLPRGRNVRNLEKQKAGSQQPLAALHLLGPFRPLPGTPFGPFLGPPFPDGICTVHLPMESQGPPLHSPAEEAGRPVACRWPRRSADVPLSMVTRRRLCNKHL